MRNNDEQSLTAYKYSDFVHSVSNVNETCTIIHGSAKQSNIHEIAIAKNKDRHFSTGDVFTALKYINKNIVSNKIIVNLPFIDLVRKISIKYNHYQDLINEITENGGIVFASPGNE
ncbi:hypothetical protein PIROE2DRAFT_15516 [Piromyces sp. E2]|nr:hypothetical protein PIROE2DRAFT_15516 [Piromyces sp. E2]|eukprot:OUM59073.1 hypothetical protein PIROE2DRAFT_15516 [Piromyces sp. E2]